MRWEAASGLSVYDPKAAVGGLLHYMLPDSGIDPARSRQNPYMFADTGIPQTARAGLRARAHRDAAWWRTRPEERSIMDPKAIFDIGKRNYLALRKILWKAGILLPGEAVGGGHSRTVRLEIGSGRLWLQENGGQKELVPSFPQKGVNTWPTGS